MGQHNMTDMERELARLRADLDAANKVANRIIESDFNNNDKIRRGILRRCGPVTLRPDSGPQRPSWARGETEIT